MDIINNAVMYFLGFKPYVLLPVIILVLSLIFRLKVKEAIKASLTIGIGFIGIFIVFDFFIKIVTPAVQGLLARSGLHLNVLETGWPPLSVISWSFAWAPVLVLSFLVINIIMLVLKLTRTVDIDIWNYWHVIFAAVLVYTGTNSAPLAIFAACLAFILVLKLAEWGAPLMEDLSGYKGLCVPHLAAISYFPLALFADWLIGKIPYLRKLDMNPEAMQQKLGLLGEPMILGLIIGTGLALGAGYDVKAGAELAVSFAGVVFILPKMCGILGSALVPVSEGMKDFIAKRFPKLGHTWIGLDVAILFGVPSVIVTALLLIPVSLVLAFVLPGVRFIPIGDLTNLMVPVAFIAVATRGNLVRSLIIGIPAVAANLYIASFLAETQTQAAAAVNYHVAGYDGIFTSFLDGGNPLRAWIFSLFTGNLIGFAFLPVVAFLVIFTWQMTKQNRPPVRK